MKLFRIICFSFLLMGASLIFIRLIPFDNKEDVNGFNYMDTFKISLFKAEGGENIRGFPFPMMSYPYNHNSSTINDINLFYNFMIYLTIVLIFQSTLYIRFDKGMQ